MNNDLKALMRDCEETGYHIGISNVRQAVTERQSKLTSNMIAATNIETPSNPKLMAKIDELTVILNLIDTLNQTAWTNDTY